VPDLLIFNRQGGCLLIELKTEKGTLTKEQKEWLDYGLVVCRSFDEAKRVIDGFT
jgi:hypothetical protein